MVFFLWPACVKSRSVSRLRANVAKKPTAFLQAFDGWLYRGTSVCGLRGKVAVLFAVTLLNAGRPSSFLFPLMSGGQWPLRRSLFPVRVGCVQCADSSFCRCGRVSAHLIGVLFFKACKKKRVRTWMEGGRGLSSRGGGGEGGRWREASFNTISMCVEAAWAMQAERAPSWSRKRETRKGL